MLTWKVLHSSSSSRADSRSSGLPMPAFTWKIKMLIYLYPFLFFFLSLTPTHFISVLFYACLTLASDSLIHGSNLLVKMVWRWSVMLAIYFMSSLSLSHTNTHTPSLSLSHLCLGLLDPWIELLGGVGEVGQILHVLAELTERTIDKSNLLSKSKLLETLMCVIVRNNA